MKSSISAIRAVFALSVIGLIAAPASALSIYDVSANHAAQEFPGENNGNGYSYDYDIDSGDTDGPLAPFLTTTPSGITATVTWNPTGSLTFTTIYLKAGGGGNSGGGYLVWDVSGVDWSIYDGFSITNTLLTHPKNGQALGISHFNAVGATVPPPPPSVPDTGISAILLGLGMISLGLLRRKRA